MDAVGIDAALIAESRGFDSKMRPALAPELPNGAIRAQFPFSERAVALHPDRFGYLVRVDFKDPELERIVSEVRARPGSLCMRIVPVPDIGEVASLERGEFEPLFAAAERVVQLDRVLELAQFPNVAIKWSHAPSLLSDESRCTTCWIRISYHRPKRNGSSAGASARRCAGPPY
jgi:hypothetical protein